MNRPILRRAPVLAGLLAAPLVACLGIFGFGDAAAVARLALEREAEFASEALLARWPSPSEGLSFKGGDILARGSTLPLTPGPWTATTSPSPEDPREGAPPSRALPWEKPGAPAPTIGRALDLHRLAALDAATRGNRDVALDQVERLEEGAGSRGGELNGLGLLTRVQALVLLGDQEDIGDLWPTDVGFRMAPGGVPFRLAAFLAAGRHLSDGQRHAEAAAIRSAIETGRMPLAQPRDTFTLTNGAPSFGPDPFWTALKEIATERAPGPDWQDAFLGQARRQWAEARWAAAELGADQPGQVAQRWRIRPIGSVGPGGTADPATPNDSGDSTSWLSVTTDDGGRWTARLHSAESLDSELNTLAPGLPEGSRVAAFTDAPDGEEISTPRILPGINRELRILHPDPNSVARAARIRQRTLRAGLVGAGILMALAALLTGRALGEADRVAALRSTFVASVSHDLRTPIASIGLMAETLRDGHAKGREDHYARSIEQEAGRLRRIVDDLLDFGRLERGLPVRLAKRNVDIAPWTEAFASRERERCRTFGGATLTLETFQLPGTANLDVEAVERALSNLIDNALKHSGADRITLSVTGSSDGGGELVFEVADAGTGLSKGALHEDLFEPFARDSATSGTGLGLSIVRAIAVAHGGHATLSPGPAGRGLVARVTVRTAADAA